MTDVITDWGDSVSVKVTFVSTRFAQDHQRELLFRIEIAGTYVGIKLNKPDLPTVQALINGKPVSRRMDNDVCWLSKPVVSGDDIDIRYDKETWEQRARRTWHEPEQ